MIVKAVLVIIHKSALEDEGSIFGFTDKGIPSVLVCCGVSFDLNHGSIFLQSICPWASMY